MNDIPMNKLAKEALEEGLTPEQESLLHEIIQSNVLVEEKTKHDKETNRVLMDMLVTEIATGSGKEETIKNALELIQKREKMKVDMPNPMDYTVDKNGSVNPIQ